MRLLAVTDLTKHYGAEPTLAGVTFEVYAGEKISLVGPNGAGKTTLLRILAGLEEPDRGTAELASSARLGYLEQQADFAAGATVWSVAEQGVGELRELARRAEVLAAAMAEATDDVQRQRLGQQFDRLHHLLAQRDGYQLHHKIERILSGLGFDLALAEQPVAQLSGGQQNRLLMARLLLSEPDVMLLDEPSNHLDIEATEWLESFLAASRSALLVVSHDRYFLDKISQRTLELLGGTIDSFAGNFSAYCRQKEERLEVQRRTYDKQQAEIAKMEDFVRRHHEGQKHAQAEDRRKKLARIDRVPPPREIATRAMGFPPAQRAGDVALRVEQLAKAYEQTLFSGLTFDIQRGEKWGILGPNGSGKTTLLRCLLGATAADRGHSSWGAHVRVAYFDQRLADLDKDLNVLEAVRPDQREFPEQQRRDLLARFGIAGDAVHQTVGSLSGGELSRTALARLAASQANFLVLDEPTNHLDLWSRAALERSLGQFDGTVLFVTHDRYFLNAVADHLLVVESERVRVVDGNYETYRYLTRCQQQGKDAVAKVVRSPRAPTTASSRRKRKFPFRAVDDLEAEIHQRESRVEALHHALAAPDVLRDGERIKQLRLELDDENQRLVALYAHWEEALELN